MDHPLSYRTNSLQEPHKFLSLQCHPNGQEQGSHEVCLRDENLSQCSGRSGLAQCNECVCWGRGGSVPESAPHPLAKLLFCLAAWGCWSRHEDVLLDWLHGQGRRPRAVTTSGPHSWTASMDCAMSTIIIVPASSSFFSINIYWIIRLIFLAFR